jgi:hypothetical protein
MAQADLPSTTRAYNLKTRSAPTRRTFCATATAAAVVAPLFHAPAHEVDEVEISEQTRECLRLYLAMSPKLRQGMLTALRKMHVGEPLRDSMIEWVRETGLSAADAARRVDAVILASGGNA